MFWAVKKRTAQFIFSNKSIITAMKLTVNQLRRIIKEEVQKVIKPGRRSLREALGGSVTVEVDYGEFPGTPRVGDVTALVARQQASFGIPATGLLHAEVVDPAGPGGGNPIVRLTFETHADAAAWWSASGYEDLGALEEFTV